MGEREEPTRSPRTRPGTHPKPHLKKRRTPLPTHWGLQYFSFGGKGTRWEISRAFLVLYNGGSSKRTGNSRTFQTESQTQVGDRAGSLADLLEP